MKNLWAQLRDRKQAQRGSVLSAVLIMVAFLAILSGALTTALSTNFLLSSDLMTRVATEATVNSAAELGITQLQMSSPNSSCPGVNPVSTNNQTAIVSYVSCWPTVDRHASQQFTPVANSSRFTSDGTHVILPGLDEYIVGDNGGIVHDYPFGSQYPRWTLPLGGSVTASPLVVPDPTNNGHFFDLIPLFGPACSPASFCLSVRVDDGSARQPSPRCTAPTDAALEVQPAVDTRNNPTTAFVGDASGDLYAIGMSTSGTCDAKGAPVSVGAPIVGGPLAFACQQGCSGTNPADVFALASDGSTTQLVHFNYTASQGFSGQTSLPLAYADATGLAVQGTSLPTQVAVTFADGHVAVVQLGANASMVRTATAKLGSPLNMKSSPHWCVCPGALNLIGVGGTNGWLYVLNTSLSTYATFPGTVSINTTPSTDALGDWYFGADDGHLYEVQKSSAGPAMTMAANFGAAGNVISSSPVIANCQQDICIYLGSLDAHDYLVTLDARDVVLTACVASGSACSGVNPRLWASVEVGVTTNPQTVHVLGWSYYSP